jgi:hypothetical protein
MNAKNIRVLAAILLGMNCQPAQAQSVATNTLVSAPTEQTNHFQQCLQGITNPVPWFAWGSDLRIRQEYFDNLITLTPANPLHLQDYYRFRARLWTSIMPITNYSLNVRLSAEPREWLRRAGYTPYKGRSGLDAGEGVFDNLNVQWKNAFGQPATLTIGRQDIKLGDGWLTGDGTPFDGTWTYFFDAARFSYEFTDQHTAIDAIGIIQDAKDNGWMPVINEEHRYFTEQNEKGAILNVVNSNFAAANLNAYFIYKHDNKVNGFDAAHPAPRGGDTGNIYTFGGRLNGILGNHWEYSTEGAYQFGQKQDQDITDQSVEANPAARMDFRTLNAFGFNGRLTYLFQDKLANKFALNYVFLSGDNPNTHNDEMFDVLWGRYARWSEVGLFTYLPESRIGQEANVQRFGPTWTITPLKKLDFSASYFAMFTPNDTATRAANPALFSGDGNFRGHFTQAFLKYKFNEHVSGHLWSEFFFPGDYYTSRTTAYFLRAELYFVF